MVWLLKGDALRQGFRDQSVLLQHIDELAKLAPNRRVVFVVFLAALKALRPTLPECRPDLPLCRELVVHRFLR